MPSKRRAAPEPTEDADRAATTPTGADAGDVADLFDSPPPSIRDVFYGDTVPPGPAPVAEGTATRSPNPLAGNRTYRVLQAVMAPDGSRVRAGELIVVPASSGLARSPFLRLVEDEKPPPNIAAAFGEVDAEPEGS